MTNRVLDAASRYLFFCHEDTKAQSLTSLVTP